MIKHRTLIESNGNILDRCIEVIDEKTEGTIEGILVDYCNNSNLVKPKWDGSGWVESATEEEINKRKEDNKDMVQPRHEETLSKEVANIKIYNMKKDSVITNAFIKNI